MAEGQENRFEHRPMDFVAVGHPTIIYVGIKDRADFDRIDRPCSDRGETDAGHVLVKTVEEDGVCVIFQHWLKSRTSAAFIADMRRERAERAEA